MHPTHRRCLQVLLSALAPALLVPLATAEPRLEFTGGGNVRISHPTLGDRQYIAEWSDDLSGWNRFPGIFTGTGEPIQWEDAPGVARSRFYRVAEGEFLGHPLHGYNFSPYLDGQDPNLGTQISRDQIKARMLPLVGYTKWVRTFGMVDGLEESGAVARELGFKVALGAWLGKQHTPEGLLANQTNIANLIASGQAGEADLLLVGSEVLHRNDLSPEILVAYINQVKAAVPGVPVTTADTYAKLADTTVDNGLGQSVTIMEACDLNPVMANFYPFWEKIPIEDALVNLNRSYHEIVRKSGGRPVWISETGWPSDGVAQGDAIPSLPNAVRYFHESVSWARIKEIPFFYFTSFSEAWKAQTLEGPTGTHWGTHDSAGEMKAGMEPIFHDPSLLPEEWNDPIDGPGDPAISFTSVPALGSTDTHVSGTASHVAPFDTFVVIYIRVGGKWWIKPFNTRHLTAIRSDGSWTAKFDTGGADATATEIAAFLIPEDYVPPLLGFNFSTLPQELFDNALASVVQAR